MNSKLQRLSRHHDQIMEIVNATPSLRPLIDFASAGMAIDSDPDMLFGEMVSNPEGLDTGLVEWALRKNVILDWDFFDPKAHWLAALPDGTLIQVYREPDGAGEGMWSVHKITVATAAALLGGWVEDRIDKVPGLPEELIRFLQSALMASPATVMPVNPATAQTDTPAPSAATEVQ